MNAIHHTVPYTQSRTKTISMIFMVVLLLIPAIYAQDMSMDELMQMTVTGATRTEQTLKDVPSTVTVFTWEQIRQLGMDSLDELANLVSDFQSFRMSDASIQSTMTSRGRRIGQVSAEIRILIDGQRLENAWTNGIAFAEPKLRHAYNQQWQTFVQAKNLFDEDYATPALGANLAHGIPNRGRECLVGIKVTF